MVFILILIILLNNNNFKYYLKVKIQDLLKVFFFNSHFNVNILIVNYYMFLTSINL